MNDLAAFAGILDGASGKSALAGFAAVVVVLLVVSLRHWKNRLEKLAEMLPALGWTRIEDPSPEALVADLLFHPNGFVRQSLPDDWIDLSKTVPAAWSGQLAGFDATLLDATIRRRDQSRRVGNENLRNERWHHLTVLRCVASPAGAPPPDFLIEERVLGKERVRGARTLDGVERIGEHYFLFSDATDEELGPWISPRLRERLAQSRLWRIAAHQGVFYLARGSALCSPAEMATLLEEGGALVAALHDGAR